MHPVLWNKSEAVTIAPNTFFFGLDNIPNRWRAFIIEVLIGLPIEREEGGEGGGERERGREGERERMSRERDSDIS